jgi:DNA-binding transcriptional ArsR family regulator
MQRDMDLARKILMEIEKFPTVQNYTFNIRGYEEQEVAYHIMLLKEASLIEAATEQDNSGKLYAEPRRLTWQGHEFLDNARDETRWNEAKKIAGQKGGSMAFDVIKGVLVQLALQTVGLR